ncbi:PadR family transcriptional regulator PadR [Arthrobacter sp. CAN_A2]|uniref:PadR family transcriptional regulator n=1 Tax=Arthrobacter sp. CAN_A2 TaxID=2787718 RepID=UPI0018EF7E44
MDDAQWPLPWIRASLDLAVLGCLVDGPLHGYGIALRLEARGFGRPRGGSLYPVLSRLEDAGYVQARWEQADAGPSRKIYSLTEPGRQHLADGLTRWQALTRALSGEQENQW